MPMQVPTVSAAELPEDAVVLDVREDDEWVYGHIEGATHVAMGEVPARLDGGMGEWEAAGRPMVSETGQPPFVR
jgi:rhodanese-related sulfurtransferase